MSPEMPPEMHFLRLRLRQITSDYTRPKHAQLIEALRDEVDHSIRILSDPNPNKVYNCVMYALGLDAEDFEIPVRAASAAHTGLIDFLIYRHYLVSHSQNINDSLVVYTVNGKTEHIGRSIDNSRIESKWGTGNLYEHKLWEVPSQYGDSVSFFAPLDHDTLVSRLCEWKKGC